MFEFRESEDIYTCLLQPQNYTILIKTYLIKNYNDASSDERIRLNYKFSDKRICSRSYSIILLKMLLIWHFASFYLKFLHQCYLSHFRH
jgi:hypothetical protein